MVMDGRLRTPPGARLLSDKRGGPVLVFTGPAAPAKKRAALEKAGAEVIGLPLKKGVLDLDEALRVLGQRDLTGVLIEGGARMIAAAIAPTRFQRFLVPIVGLYFYGRRREHRRRGEVAEVVSFYGAAGAPAIPRALRLRRMTRFTIGPDTIVEGGI